MNNVWFSTNDKLPPDGTPVIFYHREWIDEDFNPHGQREGFYNGNDEDTDWTSAAWNACQDCWMTVYIKPSHWRERPSSPE